jgi:hypothetical protein
MSVLSLRPALPFVRSGGGSPTPRPHRDHTSCAFRDIYGKDDRVVEPRRLARWPLAFPSWKSPGRRLDAGRVFRDDETPLGDASRQLAVSGGVDALDPAAEDGDRLTVRLERSPVRLAVDAAREPARHHEARRPELATEGTRDGGAVGRARSHAGLQGPPALLLGWCYLVLVSCLGRYLARTNRSERCAGKARRRLTLAFYLARSPKAIEIASFDDQGG